MMAHAVLDNKTTLLALGSEIFRRGERAQLLLGEGEPLWRHLRGVELAQFDEGRGHDGSGGGIAEGRLLGSLLALHGDAGGVVVPVGHLVLRQSRMVHQELADVTGLLQILRVKRLTIHHRVAIESPGLSAAPRAAVSIALGCVLGVRLAGDGIVTHDVEGGEVGAEVVLDRRVGVLLGDTLVAHVTCLSGHEAEHLQVHHVVDDDGVLPAGIRLPRLDDAQLLVPAGEQALRAFIDHVEVVLVARQAVALAEAAVEHEAQVVGVGHPLGRLHAVGIHLGQTAQLLVLALRVLIEHPQHAGEESRHPVVVADGLQRGLLGKLGFAGLAADARRLEGTRQCAGLVLQRVGEDERLALGTAQSALHDLRHGLLRRDGGESHCGEQDEGKGFLHNRSVF